MRSIHITLSDAVEGLRRVVDRFGEDHSTGGACRYAEFDGGRLVAVCIVGQYIADLGFLGALVTDPDGLYDTNVPKQAAACSANSEFTQILAEYGITFDEDARAFLYKAQSEQDASTPWGLALRKALNKAHDDAVAALPTFKMLGYSEND